MNTIQILFSISYILLSCYNHYENNNGNNNNGVVSRSFIMVNAFHPLSLSSFQSSSLSSYHSSLSKATTSSSTTSTTTTLSSFQKSSKQKSTKLFATTNNNNNNNNKKDRENEIRRKINRLKKNKYNNNSDSDNNNDNALDEYGDRIKSKLGKKGRLMGLTGNSDSSAVDRIGSLYDVDDDNNDDDDDDTTYSNNNNMEGNDYIADEEEESMINLVEQKLLQKAKLENELLEKENNEKKSLLKPTMDDLVQEMENDFELQRLEQQRIVDDEIQRVTTDNDDDDGGGGVVISSTNNNKEQTTTGVGGTWTPPTSTSTSDKNITTTETYRPANGGWGYFPRPKDISKTYGGGRKISSTQTFEDERRVKNMNDDTKNKLKEYREKVGIIVVSEGEHMDEIQEARVIGQRGMERGRYDISVSALEKVTSYCSTNSKVGSMVFLELAMAYEAVGRLPEAIKVYTQLTFSRQPDTARNAKTLLGGIEAIKFMREEVKIKTFQKGTAAQTFIETTGFDNAWSDTNFDDKYNSAYINLDSSSSYKMLTENVVRSSREARNILLKATNSGEINRLKVIQALRSLERYFVEELNVEIESRKVKDVPVVLMNGKPILTTSATTDTDTVTTTTTSNNNNNNNSNNNNNNMFKLLAGEQMLSNLKGEWKLQLIANSNGDGVSYQNKTKAWQLFNTTTSITSTTTVTTSTIPTSPPPPPTTTTTTTTTTQTFTSSSPGESLVSFLTLDLSGNYIFNNDLRILQRSNVIMSGSGAFFSNLNSGGGGTTNTKTTGIPATIQLPQQIIIVDSELLVTRRSALDGSSSSSSSSSSSGGGTATKDYFSVWRRVEPGTYSS